MHQSQFKKSLLAFILFFMGHQADAQVVAELSANNRYTAHEIWLERFFSTDSKFSFFNYTRFRVKYQADQGSEVLSYSTLNYEIGKGFGIATGGFVFGQDFLPVFAANYTFHNDTWLVNIFPSIELRKRPNLEQFMIVQFRPKISLESRLFSQVLATSNFNLQRHNFSEVSIRLGVDYRSFQWGLGSDLSISPQAGTSNVQKNLGVFIRKEFN